MIFELDAIVRSRFQDYQSPMGLVSLDLDELNNLKISLQRPALIFSHKFEAFNVELLKENKVFFVGIDSLLILPAQQKISIQSYADFCHLSLILPDPELFSKVEKICKFKNKKFEQIFAEPCIIQRKNWMNEIFHRLIYERIQEKQKNSYVIDFLEIEILKELHYNYRDFIELKDSLEFSYDGMTLNKKNEILKSAIIYIEGNLFKRPGIKEIADHIGASESTLQRLFRKEFQCGPASYLKNRLLHEARHLLRTTELATADLAAECGYSTPSSFIYAFRKKFGISPQQFLSQYK